MNRLKIITKYFVRNAFEEMFASGKKIKPVFCGNANDICCCHALYAFYCNDR